MATQGSLPLSHETISGLCYDYSAINGGVVGAGSVAPPLPAGAVESKGRQMGGKMNTLNEKQIIFSLKMF